MAFYLFLPVLAWAIARRNRRAGGERPQRLRRQWGGVGRHGAGRPTLPSGDRAHVGCMVGAPTGGPATRNWGPGCPITSICSPWAWPSWWWWPNATTVGRAGHWPAPRCHLGTALVGLVVCRRRPGGVCRPLDGMGLGRTDLAMGEWGSSCAMAPTSRWRPCWCCRRCSADRAEAGSARCCAAVRCSSSAASPTASTCGRSWSSVGGSEQPTLRPRRLPNRRATRHAVPGAVLARLRGRWWSPSSWPP